MYLQEIVEVAMGLIFSWLLLSIAVLQVQEVISHILAKRSGELENVIRDILDDPEKVKQFYSHPLIKSLSKPKKLSGAEKLLVDDLEKKDNLTLNEKRTLARLRPRPSYIPSSNFASAIFDLVVDAGTEKSPISDLVKDMRRTIDDLKGGDKERMNAILEGIYQLGQTAAKSKAGVDFQNGVKTELKNQIERLGKEHPELKSHADKLIGSIDSNQYNLGALFKSDLALDQLRGGAQVLLQGNSKLGKAINGLLAGAEEYATTADKALAIGRKNVEAWFDSSMERLSGWYKRWAQTWAFALGLVIAIVFNVDSIHIAERLWNNPALRQASAVYIDNFVKEKTANGSPLDETELNTLQKDLEKLKYPAGWGEVGNEVAQEITHKDHIGLVFDWIFFGFGKLFGWLITAGAAMQGAPFWFDILKKLVNVRSSGANPNEKPKGETTTNKD